MKTVCVVIGLLASFMAAESFDMDMAELVKRSSGNEEGYLDYATVYFHSLFLKEVVENAVAIHEGIESFGGLKGFEEFIEDTEKRLAVFVDKKKNEGTTPTSSPPVNRSADVKRSMKDLLQELEKLTNKN